MNKTAAIVVTYNRLAFLKENLSALLTQSAMCDIIVIDNNSTDGTDEYIHSIHNDRIIYINTGKNIGGAGGFSVGIRVAEENEYQYAWVMDDDSIPNTYALESLLEKAERINNEFSFLASLVYWIDGTILEMNFPNYKHRRGLDICPEYISQYKIMPIESATFVGCFINLAISRQAGLPIADFFIYCDDVEYTERIRKLAPAYLDFDSIIIHKAPSNKGADIVTASVDRIDRFYFQSRNGIYVARKEGGISLIRRIGTVLKRSGKIIAHSSEKKMKRLLVLYKGSLAGFFFAPAIEYNEK